MPPHKGEGISLPSGVSGLPPLDSRYQSRDCSHRFEHQLDYLVGGRLFIWFFGHTLVLLSCMYYTIIVVLCQEVLQNFFIFFSIFLHKKTSPRIRSGGFSFYSISNL